MAKQSGVITLNGKIGNVSFFTDQEGVPRARRKGGPKASQVKTGENYLLLRYHQAEFTKASAFASAIAHGLSVSNGFTSDGNYFSRLTGLVNAIQKTDAKDPSGPATL